MNKTVQQGFTFIELIAAMAVMAILLGIGIPSFSNAMKNSRIAEESRGLIGSLYIARSEAIKSGANVTVCARATDSTCGTDWKNGWLVFTDTNFLTTETIPTFTAATDEIVDIRPPLGGNSIISKGSAAGSDDADDYVTRNYIRYNARGEANWEGATFVLCDDRGEESGRSINIVLTGDIRPGRKDPTTKIPKDVFNTDISCS